MNTTRRAVAFAAALGCTLRLYRWCARSRIIHRTPSPSWCRSRRAGRPIRWGAFWASGCGSTLGQTIVIENVTGAGSSIGVARAVQAAPDGYTLSLGNWTSLVGSGALYPVC